MQLAALRLRQELECWWCARTTFPSAVRRELFAEDELRHGIHGGEMETSLMLHPAPTWFVAKRSQIFERSRTKWPLATDCLDRKSRSALAGWSQDLHEHGVCGNAARADAERGEVLLSYLADKLATLLAECQSLPLSTLRESRPY